MNKEEKAEYDRRRYAEKREEILGKLKTYRDLNKVAVSESKKKSYRKNPEHYKNAARKWGSENRDRRNAMRRERYSEIRKAAASGDDLDAVRQVLRLRAEGIRAARKRAETVSGNLHARISGGIRHHLKMGGKFRRRTEELLGWTMDELKAHLEANFEPGMNWGNMRLWHIDHIVPVVSFSLTGVDDPNIRAAWSLSNLRPLWARENQSKSDRMPDGRRGRDIARKKKA